MQADAGAGGGIETKMVLKICWRLFSNHQATENEAKMTGGARTAAGMGACNTAGVLLPLMEVAPTSLSLPPKGEFWGKVRQVEDWAIELAE